VFNLNPSALAVMPKPPVTGGLTGYYHGGSYTPSRNLWMDESGLNNHAVTSGSVIRAAWDGAGRYFVYGTVFSKAMFPQVTGALKSISCAAVYTPALAT
jgi:hypothetical protein